MKSWTLVWRVIRHSRWTFWGGWALFVLFFTLPVAIGWALSRAFDALARGDSSEVYRWVVVLVVVEVARMASIHAGVLVWARVWLQMQTFLRANMLAAQVASGGPEAGQPVGSAGEAVTHFRDDAEDVARFIDSLVDVSAGLVFTMLAGVVLGATNAAGALVLVAPLVVVAIVTKSLDARIRRYRAADREATGAVTGLVGDVMAAATTIKVNDAAPAVLDRLRVLVDRRRITAVRDRVLDEGVYAFSRGATDVGLGLVLIVGAGALSSGRFDVGELALFVAYLGWLSFLPRMAGRSLARYKQAGVAFERMAFLVADCDPENTVNARSLPIGVGKTRTRPGEVRPERVPLERFEVVGLSARYPSGVGVADVSFSVARSEFVVVTGPVGSGKSTLLRALLGLAWQADVTGAVWWNGSPVEDAGAFLVPPNAAFLPQVPQLISDSVADNIAFGRVDAERIARAIELAVMDVDIAEMPQGVDTMIGPRGLRLSGGQRQRLAGRGRSCTIPSS